MHVPFWLCFFLGACKQAHVHWYVSAYWNLKFYVYHCLKIINSEKTIIMKVVLIETGLMNLQTYDSIAHIYINK